MALFPEKIHYKALYRWRGLSDNIIEANYNISRGRGMVENPFDIIAKHGGDSWAPWNSSLTLFIS